MVGSSLIFGPCGNKSLLKNSCQPGSGRIQFLKIKLLELSNVFAPISNEILFKLFLNFKYCCAENHNSLKHATVGRQICRFLFTMSEGLYQKPEEFGILSKIDSQILSWVGYTSLFVQCFENLR